jgi:hypothetical protein
MHLTCLLMTIQSTQTQWHLYVSCYVDNIYFLVEKVPVISYGNAINLTYKTIVSTTFF